MSPNRELQIAPQITARVEQLGSNVDLIPMGIKPLQPYIVQAYNAILPTTSPQPRRHPKGELF
jgi:hypothetical protein